MPNLKEWITKLISEEKQAVKLYKEAISDCDDEDVIEVYEHILKEEEEHIEELKAILPHYYNTELRLKQLKRIQKRRQLTEEEYEEMMYCENEIDSREAETRYLNGRDSISDSEDYNEIYYSIEGSEEGEIFDKIKTLKEAKSKVKELKDSDKSYDIEQNYYIYKHFVTDTEDYIQEV